MNSILVVVWFFSIVLFPYTIYVAGIFFGRKQLPVWQLASIDVPLPKITVVFSAYNEEKNIEKRIVNLKNCSYPSIALVVVDDCSSDNTLLELKKWLDWSGFEYNLIENSGRRGVSESYNFAIGKATTDIVVVTDADVLFKHDALHLIVKRLISGDKIGAVTGDLQPDGARFASLVMEEQYRSVYGDMCEWESAHDSTMNFNGALIAFRKSAVQTIPRKGADDANIAFAAIRNGFRAVYEKDAIVYENIPRSFKVQYKQKIRRAHGILMAMWENMDLLSSERPFSLFFLARVWMYFFSPALFFMGMIMYPPIVLLVLLGMIIPMFRAFVFNQFYLIAGLLYRKDTAVWESTSSQHGEMS